MRKHFNNKGSALITVIVVMVVLMILSMALLTVSAAEAKHAIMQENKTQAQYVARAGAEAVANALRATPSMNPLLVGTVSEAVNSQGHTFTANIHSDPVSGDPSRIRIDSSATVNGRSQEVSLYMSKGYPYFEHAIFGDLVLGLGGSPTPVYEGNVGTNASSSTGNVNFLHENGDSADDEFGIQLNANKDMPDIDVAAFGGATPLPNISGDFLIDLNDDTTYPPDDTNDAGDPIVYATVDSIDIVGNGTIQVQGPGELHLLINNTFEIGGTAGVVTSDTPENPDPDTLVYLYYAGTNTLIFNGTPSFYGFIYAPDATISWNGGGNGALYGSIVAEQITLQGGTAEFHFVSDLDSQNLKLRYKKMFWAD